MSVDLSDAQIGMRMRGLMWWIYRRKIAAVGVELRDREEGVPNL